jgi:hypothetical protein
MRTSFKGKFAQQEKVFKFNLCFIWLLANIKFSTKQTTSFLEQIRGEKW